MSLHNDFTVRLANNKGEEKVTVDLNAKEFVEAVKGKDASAYGAEYKSRAKNKNLRLRSAKRLCATAFPTR